MCVFVCMHVPRFREGDEIVKKVLWEEIGPKLCLENWGEAVRVEFGSV